jgi:hypothetical protein
MANAVYQSPSITTQAQKKAALISAAVLFEHLAAGTGGYTVDYVQSDFGITAANKLTITLTGPLPDAAQTTRYNLTQIA